MLKHGDWLCREGNLFDKWGPASLQRLKAADLERISNRKWFPSSLLALTAYYQLESGGRPLVRNKILDYNNAVLFHFSITAVKSFFFFFLLYNCRPDWKACKDCWKTAKKITILGGWGGGVERDGLLKTQALGSKAGFLRSAAIIFRQSLETLIHISTAFLSTPPSPLSRQFNTQSSTARSIKDDQLLDSLSDRCLAAGCLSLESSRCPEGDRYDLARALLDSSAKWVKKLLLFHHVEKHC